MRVETTGQVTETGGLKLEENVLFVAIACGLVPVAARASLMTEETAYGVVRATWHVWIHDYDSSRGWRDVYAVFRESLSQNCRLGQRISGVGIFGGSALVWRSGQVKWTVCVRDVKAACSGSRPTASGGELTTGRMCQALAAAMRSRDLLVVGVGSTPWLLDDA